MVVLVMLEETPGHSPVLAQVNSVPSPLSNERPSRDVVTLYGVPSAESLALALAAALESRRAGVPEEHHSDAVRHVGVWPGRGAIGDAAWRDRSTGQLVTRDLEIPLAVLLETSGALLSECGQAIRRLVAGLLMPDWPEGTRRAITFSFAPAFAGTGMPNEALLASLREADGTTYDSEGDN
jgi:hypothetical protein